MAERAVRRHGVSIALACRTFGLSETCYRYNPKLDTENERIGDLLSGLTKVHRTWGFGLCFLHLRNVKGHRWNHKRVYRIYRELELNLRIKPRRCIDPSVSAQVRLLICRLALAFSCQALGGVFGDCRSRSNLQLFVLHVEGFRSDAGGCIALSASE